MSNFPQKCIDCARGEDSVERLEVNLGELGSSLSLYRSARKLKLPLAQ